MGGTVAGQRLTGQRTKAEQGRGGEYAARCHGLGGFARRLRCWENTPRSWKSRSRGCTPYGHAREPVVAVPRLPPQDQGSPQKRPATYSPHKACILLCLQQGRQRTTDGGALLLELPPVHVEGAHPVQPPPHDQCTRQHQQRRAGPHTLGHIPRHANRGVPAGRCHILHPDPRRGAGGGRQRRHGGPSGDDGRAQQEMGKKRDRREDGLGMTSGVDRGRVATDSGRVAGEKGAGRGCTVRRREHKGLRSRILVSSSQLPLRRLWQVFFRKLTEAFYSFSQRSRFPEVFRWVCTVFLHSYHIHSWSRCPRTKVRRPCGEALQAS